MAKLMYAKLKPKHSEHEYHHEKEEIRRERERLHDERRMNREMQRHFDREYKLDGLVDEVKDVIECIGDIFDGPDYYDCDDDIILKARGGRGRGGRGGRSSGRGRGGYGGRGRARDSMGRFKGYNPYRMEDTDYMDYNDMYMGYPTMMAYGSNGGNRGGSSYGNSGGNYSSGGGYSGSRGGYGSSKGYGMDYYPMTTMKHHDEDEKHKKRDREEGFDEKDAKEWVKNMDFSTGEKGGKWTPDNIKPYAEKKGIKYGTDEFWEFYAVMNSLYSDYAKTLIKYNAATPDLFADLAMDFINDPDASEDKVKLYYDYIAE